MARLDRGLGAAARPLAARALQRERMRRITVMQEAMKGDSHEYAAERFPFIGDFSDSGYEPRFGARRGASSWGSKQWCAKPCIHSGFLGHVGASILKRLRTAAIGSRSSDKQGAPDRPAGRRQ